MCLRLSWIALFAGVFLVLNVGRADAETMLASWYGPGFEGLPTATGEPYDPYGYTAAHKTLPFGTELLVSYEGNSVEVTINDRGPYVGDRELDLSQGAAQALGFIEPGVDYVEYAYAGGAAYQYADDGGGAYGQYASAAYDQYGYSGSDGAGGYDVVDYSGYDEYGHDGAAATETASYPSYAEDVSYQQIVSYPAEEAGAGGGSYVVVQPGETLSGISTGLGISVEHLAAYNGLADPDLIYAGQTLYF